MLAATYPLQVLLLTVSAIVNRHQADVIAYLVEENRVPQGTDQGTEVRFSPQSGFPSRKHS
jgi:hypothetical protein